MRAHSIFALLIPIPLALAACAGPGPTRQPTAAEIAESRMVSCPATDINDCYRQARAICDDAYEILHEPEPLPGRKEREVRVRCAHTKAGEGTPKF